jgi:hypothetical protein
MTDVSFSEFYYRLFILGGLMYIAALKQYLQLSIGQFENEKNVKKITKSL